MIVITLLGVALLAIALSLILKYEKTIDKYPARMIICLGIMIFGFGFWWTQYFLTSKFVITNNSQQAIRDVELMFFASATSSCDFAVIPPKEHRECRRHPDPSGRFLVIYNEPYPHQPAEMPDKRWPLGLNPIPGGTTILISIEDDWQWTVSTNYFMRDEYSFTINSKTDFAKPK